MLGCSISLVILPAHSTLNLNVLFRWMRKNQCPVINRVTLLTSVLLRLRASVVLFFEGPIAVKYFPQFSQCPWCLSYTWQLTFVRTKYLILIVLSRENWINFQTFQKNFYLKTLWNILIVDLKITLTHVK